MYLTACYHCIVELWYHATCFPNDPRRNIVENFPHNFIFLNRVQRHICDVKNSRQGHDLRIADTDRGISSFREEFSSRNFAYSKFLENKPS